MIDTVDAALRALKPDADRLRATSVLELFAREPERLGRMSLEAAGWRLDVSKQLIDLPTFDRLIGVAAVAGLADARAAMLRGAAINRTEARAVLHVALRAQDGYEQSATVREVLMRMEHFVTRVREGDLRGYSGLPFTDVVNIGIGGSHLGPELACDALRYATAGKPRAHFLANVDSGAFDRILGNLNPESTLFVIASKSFTTAETRLNAATARAWLLARAGDEKAIGQHFVVVTSRPDRALEFGVDAASVYPMWDWVGGRFSLWSAIGMPIALHFGMPAFRELLAGAAKMDEHFSETPLLRNMPVLLALIGVWNSHCLNAESYAVVPYDDRLRHLPAYLQQLEMESNGKRVTLDNAPLDGHSAPVTWGGLGTNAQHAFFQLLHQGTRLIPVDFIIAMTHPAGRREHHDMLVANCLAQAEALMTGRKFPAGERDANGIELAAHRSSPGNRPNSMLTTAALTPASLGALLALYEHKTFVQSVIWDINAFDQWGVELGKDLAGSILHEIEQGVISAHDPSTSALIETYLANRVR